MRDALQYLLSVSGYRAELYASAEEFISAATTTAASCLVVDMNLGGMSGLDLGHYLRAAGFAFPIIFMTGSTNEILQRQAADFGSIAFLNKPFSANLLIEALTKSVSAAVSP